MFSESPLCALRYGPLSARSSYSTRFASLVCARASSDSTLLSVGGVLRSRDFPPTSLTFRRDTSL